MERWVSVVDWEGYYDVSDLGNVRCCPRFVDRDWGAVWWSGDNLKMRKHSNGYSRVQLSRNGESKDFYVHRLVADAFISNLDNRPYVNHINGIKDDNSLSNLEWVTPSQNSQHAYDSGLRQRILINVIDKNNNVIYDSVTVHDLVSLGFQQPAISRCLSGKMKTHKGFKYEIKENV